MPKTRLNRVKNRGVHIDSHLVKLSDQKYLRQGTWIATSRSCQMSTYVCAYLSLIGPGRFRWDEWTGIQ